MAPVRGCAEPASEAPSRARDARLLFRLAGVAGRVPHDFRRTAVRNLERAGVPRKVAMAMVGHKTESVYRRYDIVTDSDLHAAAAKINAAMVTKTVTKGQSGKF